MKKLFTVWNTFLIADLMVMTGVAIDGSVSAALIVGGIILMVGLIGRAIGETTC